MLEPKVERPGLNCDSRKDLHTALLFGASFGNRVETDKPKEEGRIAAKTECSGERGWDSSPEPRLSKSRRVPGWVGLLLTWHKMRKAAVVVHLPTLKGSLPKSAYPCPKPSCSSQFSEYVSVVFRPNHTTVGVCPAPAYIRMGQHARTGLFCCA